MTDEAWRLQGVRSDDCGAGAQRGTVLLAMADDTSRTQLALALRRSGCEVLQVADSTQLVNHLRRFFVPDSPVDPLNLIDLDARLDRLARFGARQVLDGVAARAASVRVGLAAEPDAALPEACTHDVAVVVDDAFELDHLRALTLLPAPRRAC